MGTGQYSPILEDESDLSLSGTGGKSYVVNLQIVVILNSLQCLFLQEAVHFQITF
jgi:hypothetical protein